MDEEEKQRRVQRYNEAFQEADRAAAKGDAAGVMDALLQPHVLSGLAYRLDNKWREKRLYTIQRDDTELVIVESLKAIYEMVTSNRGPKNIGAYLYVVSLNKGYAIHAIRGGAKGQVSVESLDNLRDSSDDYKVVDFTSWEEQHRQLIRVVRKVVVPTLGRENIQRVWDYIFEALEKGTYATNQEIAEALGVSQENVRAWRSKGLRRLPDRLAKAGFLSPDSQMHLDEILGEQAHSQGETSDDED